MGTSIFTDAELDAMTRDEAWERCCYAAWIVRAMERQHAMMSNALEEVRAEAVDGLRQHKCDDPSCGICGWNRFAEGG